MFNLEYQSCRANGVVDALSRKNYSDTVCLALEDWKFTVTIAEFDLQFYDDGCQAYVFNLIPTPSLVQQGKQSR